MGPNGILGCCELLHHHFQACFISFIDYNDAGTIASNFTVCCHLCHWRTLEAWVFTVSVKRENYKYNRDSTLYFKKTFSFRSLVTAITPLFIILIQGLSITSAFHSMILRKCILAAMILLFVVVILKQECSTW